MILRTALRRNAPLLLGLALLAAPRAALADDLTDSFDQTFAAHAPAPVAPAVQHHAYATPPMAYSPVAPAPQRRAYVAPPAAYVK